MATTRRSSTFEFGQQIDFTHNGKPYLHYVSQTYVVDEDGRSSGRWRWRPGSGDRSRTRQLEVVLAHPTGYAEVWYGEIDGAKIEFGPTWWPGRRRPRRSPPVIGCTAWFRAS